MEEVFIFQENEKYNHRSGTHLTNRNIHTAHFGTDTIIKTWIKTWTTNNCPCRLCKTFVKNLGFIEVFPNL